MSYSEIQIGWVVLCVGIIAGIVRWIFRPTPPPHRHEYRPLAEKETPDPKVGEWWNRRDILDTPWGKYKTVVEVLDIREDWVLYGEAENVLANGTYAYPKTAMKDVFKIVFQPYVEVPKVCPKKPTKSIESQESSSKPESLPEADSTK